MSSSPPLSHCTPAPLQPSASRATWIGQLAFGPLSIPVKAHPSVVVPSHGPLHQIHTGCGERISQRKLCPKHGELNATEIGKAFEYAQNDHIELNDEELDSLLPSDEKTILIEHLLPSAKVELSLLSGRSMYLVPAHAAAAYPFAKAAMLLSNRNTWAIGRMILSDQMRTVALNSQSEQLIAYVLHWPEHRRSCPATSIEGKPVTNNELRAFEKSLLPLYASFSWDEYRDQGADRLQRLIADKIADRGGRTRPQSRKRSRRKDTAVATRRAA